MNELALFAGGGGGILGGKLLGWRTVCAVEIERYARDVLLARQNDGILEPFPIWDDVRSFDGRPWAGIVDVVSTGFPCQDIAICGRGAGITGKRSGLWTEAARIIREVEPGYVLVENSPALTSRGLGVVLGDLVAMGFDARWGVLGAVHAGAPHKRERIWIVANAKQSRLERQRSDTGQSQESKSGNSSACPFCGYEFDIATLGKYGCANCHAEGLTLADAGEQIGQRRPHWIGWGSQGEGANPEESRRTSGERHDWWQAEPDVGRVADGVASRVDRLAALGNGQCPQVVALAWEILHVKP